MPSPLYFMVILVHLVIESGRFLHPVGIYYVSHQLLLLTALTHSCYCDMECHSVLPVLL